jgi:hypothetical protein
MVNRITASELTPVPLHLGVVFMGDKSPKATSKQAAQKQGKGRRRKPEEKRRCQRQASSKEVIGESPAFVITEHAPIAVRCMAFQKVAHSLNFFFSVRASSPVWWDTKRINSQIGAPGICGQRLGTI